MMAFANWKMCAIAVVAPAAFIQAAQQPAQHIDVKKVSENIQDVVVPRPDEIFGALNKLGSINWQQFVRTDKSSNFMERPRIALLLGTVIADGFIAVQAQDAPAVKDIGARVQTLARDIGVERSITSHAKAIIEAADKRKWENVRQELDRTQQSVQAAMNELRDEKLSQLVSVGGWLRGTEVLTSVVTKNFSADGAELLHQPDLLDHFQSQLSTMPEKYNVTIVREIQTALGEVKPMVATQGSGKISAASVKKINEITTRLDNGIVTKE